MMNIALGFDSNFAPYAAVTIKSILLHNKNIKFYILYDNLKQTDINKIDKLIQTGDNCSAEWIDMKGKFDHLNAGGWNSKSVYFPVALPSLCPDDRILFLDADIIVNNSLEEIYNQALEGYYLAGTLDYGIMSEFNSNSKVTSQTCGGDIPAKDYFKTIFGYTDIKDFETYINGGILLLNLKAIRNDDIENKMYEVFNKIDFALNEQDCFNYICKDKKKLLQNKDAILILKDYVIKDIPNDYKHEYISNCDQNINHTIVHFIKKPWLYPEENIPYSSVFQKLRNLTPYKYFRHRKEIFKFRLHKKAKYFVLFGHTIFSDKKNTKNLMESNLK